MRCAATGQRRRWPRLADRAAAKDASAVGLSCSITAEICARHSQEPQRQLRTGSGEAEKILTQLRPAALA